MAEFGVNENVKDWYYTDENETEQGPFSLAEMRGWWRAGCFPADIRVRKQKEYKFTLLQGRLDFIMFQDPSKISEPPVEQPVEQPVVPEPTPEPEKPLPPQAQFPKIQYRDYSVSGTFNTRTGRFDSQNFDQPVDRELRQMSYYFDLDQYQRIKSGDERRTKKNTGKVPSKHDVPLPHHPYKKDTDKKQRIQL